MRRLDGLDRQILAVAVPAFLSLITEPLMLLADTAVIGHLGTTELGGLAAASVVLTTVVGLCVFLAYGSTAAVARRHGAGRQGAAYSQAVGGLWLALGLGIVLGLGVAAASSRVCDALASSDPVAEQADRYLVLSSAAIPAMLLVLASTGALRGVLDLRTPLLVTVVANLLNIALNITLVYGFDLGIAGAAIGTVVAQWIAALWLVAAVVRGARRARASVHPRVGAVLRAARDGVPLLARTLTLRAALLVATAVAADLGDVPLAAHQVTMSLVTFLAFALDAVAIAGQTLTGRSLGAGDADGTREATRRMTAWGLGTGIVAAVLLAATSPLLALAFTSDEAVRDALVPALLVAAAIQPVSGIVFVLDGVLIGAGDGVYLAWAGLAVLAVYTPTALLVDVLGASFTWLWVAYAGFIAARLVTLWVRQRSDRWLVLGD